MFLCTMRGRKHRAEQQGHQRNHPSALERNHNVDHASSSAWKVQGEETERYAPKHPEKHRSKSEKRKMTSEQMSEAPTNTSLMTDGIHLQGVGRPSKRPRMDDSLQSTEGNAIATVTESGASARSPKHKSNDNIFLQHDLHHLTAKHKFITVTVISSSKIEAKVKQLLAHLSRKDGTSARERIVVILRSKAAVTSKMVAIIEIVKKQLAKDHLKTWQYSRLEGVVEDFKDKARCISHGTIEGVNRDRETGEVDEDDGSEGYFENMPSREHGTSGQRSHTVRNMPYITVFLSRSAISELKLLYG